jgi:hypothetical protein
VKRREFIGLLGADAASHFPALGERRHKGLAIAFSYSIEV